jgi:tight adherence protein B
VTPSSLAAVGSAASVLLVGAALADARRPWGLASRGDEGVSSARAPSVRARSLLVGIVGMVAGWLVAGPPGIVAGAAIGGVAPFVRERRRNARAAARTQEQLLDAVAAIASSVRSGRSLAQSIAFAGAEVGPPLGTMLADGADRVALGVPLDEVLGTLAATIGGPDARLVTGVLRLHRRSGGAIAGSLDDLVRTLRARRDGARELRSLTAQARLSAVILGLLPLGFFLFLSVVARRDVESAYRTTAGATAIAIGLVLQAAAFVWIRRLLRVEDA